jgi:hypothetical protein
LAKAAAPAALITAAFILAKLPLSALTAAVAASPATAALVACVLGDRRGGRQQAQAQCEKAPSHVSTPRKSKRSEG